MTRVDEADMYEFPMQHDTATCEECGAEISVDVDDDVMDAPHWRRVPLGWPASGDAFDALCDPCYADEVAAIIRGGEEAAE